MGNVAQRFKPLLEILISHWRQQLITQAPAIYVGDLQGISGSWIWPGSVQHVADIWGVSQQLDGLSHSFQFTFK